VLVSNIISEALVISSGVSIGKRFVCLNAPLSLDPLPVIILLLPAPATPYSALRDFKLFSFLALMAKSVKYSV
jgi:hypothetical protein